VFCPNCGTQNPETAPACSKCNFNLKAAAAPKFKGTMLMMNQPGSAPPAGIPGSAPPGVPPAAPPGAAASFGGPPGAPRPVPMAAPNNKLKGTMVGVAPPMPPIAGKPGSPSVPSAANYAPPQQNYAPPAQQNYAPPPQQNYAPPAQQNYAPPPQQNYAPPAQQNYAPPPQQNYAPPPQQGYPSPAGYGSNLTATEVDAVPAGGQAQFGGGQGVNPLGGTMAADTTAFSPYAPPSANYAAPAPGFSGGAGAPPAYGGAPDGAGYGAAPGAPPAYGAAPGAGYGAAPNYAAPPGGYGAPAQPGYGSNSPLPPYGQQTYGQPGAPPQVYGQPMGGPPPGALVTQASAGLLSATAGGTRPIARNAWMVVLLPIGINIISNIVVRIIAAIAVATGVLALLWVGTLISLVFLAAVLYFFFVPLYKMACEVKSVTNNQAFNPYLALIPIYGSIMLLMPEVTNAKRIVGAQEAVRNIFVYIFFPNYGVAADLNDIAARMR
jgi:hypothetical protein